MTSPGQKSIWPSVCCQDSTLILYLDVKSLLKNKYFYWLDSFLYHSLVAAMLVSLNVL